MGLSFSHENTTLYIFGCSHAHFRSACLVFLQFKKYRNNGLDDYFRTICLIICFRHFKVLIRAVHSTCTRFYCTRFLLKEVREFSYCRLLFDIVHTQLLHKIYSFSLQKWRGLIRSYRQYFGSHNCQLHRLHVYRLDYPLSQRPQC